MRSHQNCQGAEVGFARETRRSNLRGIPSPKSVRVRRAIAITSLVAVYSALLSFNGHCPRKLHSRQGDKHDSDIAAAWRRANHCSAASLLLFLLGFYRVPSTLPCTPRPSRIFNRFCYQLWGMPALTRGPRAPDAFRLYLPLHPAPIKIGGCGGGFWVNLSRTDTR